MTSPLLWSLIAIQIVMGAFDTFYHHEMTERLAWRPSQRYELKLHGVRNMLYAALFLVLGWLEVHGLLAVAITVVLVAEIGVGDRENARRKPCRQGQPQCSDLEKVAGAAKLQRLPIDANL